MLDRATEPSASNASWKAALDVPPPASQQRDRGDLSSCPDRTSIEQVAVRRHFGLFPAALHESLILEFTGSFASQASKSNSSGSMSTPRPTRVSFTRSPGKTEFFWEPDGLAAAVLEEFGRGASRHRSVLYLQHVDTINREPPQGGTLHSGCFPSTLFRSPFLGRNFSIRATWAAMSSAENGVCTRTVLAGW